MKLDASDLKELQPLIDAAVRATLAEIEGSERAASDRLGFPEPEAAALMGVERHVLRDCRLRGDLYGRKVGKRVVYSRDSLVRFLADGGPRR